MPRPRILPQADFPYSVGARCINREWFNLPMEEVWDSFSRHLYAAKFAFNLKIHSFVLMHNHFHLLVSTPEANLSAAMAYFMRAVSIDLTRSGNRTNQTFGGRHFRSVVSSYHYYMHAYKYFYVNPVRAGICQRPEDYEFSTLRGKLGSSHLLIPVEEDTLLFDNMDQTLTWLNTRSNPDHLKAIQWALHRAEFRLPKNSRGQGDHPLESQLL